jgi:hypothetical protein
MVAVHIFPQKSMAMQASGLDLTVEAEYGDYVLEGSIYTAAHHQASGPYAGRHLPEHVMTGRPSPCNDHAIPVVDGVIGVSHIDLDTIGGCLRGMGTHPELFHPAHQAFWAYAEFVDTSGVHKISPTDPMATLYYAWMAWSGANRPSYAMDSVSDITEHILLAASALHRILLREDALIHAGMRWADAQDEINKQSFLMIREGVIYRKHSGFVNSLYTTPQGETGIAIISHNPNRGSYSLSVPDLISGVSCAAIMQSVFGDGAGGHAAIAGTPRGVSHDGTWFDAIFHSFMSALGK